jgi:hypothetical protein
MWMRVFVCAASLALAAADARAAGGAYATDTAEVSEVGNCKVESWTSFASNQDFLAAANPSCVVDLTRPVELSTQIVRGRSDGEWNTFVAPKFKTNLIPTAIGQWGVAIAGGAIYDAAANDIGGFFAYVPATLRLSKVMRINVNAGWTWDRLADIHYATYAAGVDWRTPDNVWTLTAEVFGLVGDSDKASGKQPRFQLGTRWRPVDRLSFDVIYGRNILGENANWVTFGTSIRFPASGGPSRAD